MKTKPMSCLNPDKVMSFRVDVFKDPEGRYFAECNMDNGRAFWTSTYTTAEEAIVELSRRVVNG